jgi:hypothetical protein
MANLKFNTGRDLTATITIAGLLIKQFGLHKSTKITPKWTIESETPTNLGGITITKPIFMGYDVVIDVTRQNGVVEDIQTFLEANYFAGNPDPAVTLLETVRNDDGTVNQYNYLDGSVWVTERGDYPGVSKVAQAVNMFFPRSLAITTNSPVTIGGGALVGLGSGL